MLVIV